MISPLIVAVLTPFDEKGAVDQGALRDYLALLSAAGVQTILVNGTTGEFFAMTSRERGAVLEFCREHWPGQVIAHVGSAAIGDAIELLDHARSHTDYLAAITPYYYASPPEEGVCAYFRQLLARSDLPLFLYNFPRHTQTDLTPSIVSRLAAEFPLLRGVKDSGTDRELTRRFKAVRPDLQVFIGDDRDRVRESRARRSTARLSPLRATAPHERHRLPVPGDPRFPPPQDAAADQSLVVTQARRRRLPPTRRPGTAPHGRCCRCRRLSCST